MIYLIKQDKAWTYQKTSTQDEIKYEEESTCLVCSQELCKKKVAV